MSAIDFVVRDVAGNMQRGSVSGEGATHSTILVGADADISLNLYRAHIVGYSRQGQALQITLIDGNVVVIEGFFGADGIPANRLLISADGQMAEVELTGGDEGIYYAQYAEADSFGKWSPDDDLYFVRGQEVQIAEAATGAYQDDEVGMLAAPLLGGIGGITSGLGIAGAGVVGAALVGGGGGGESGPVVDITDGTATTVTEQDLADGVTIGGTGTPGGMVEVSIDGAVQTGTVGEDGTWEVTFPSGEVAPGDYETTVTVTLTDEDGETATATETLVVDSIVDLSADTIEGDNVISAVELEDGVQIGGSVEAGSSVVVTIDGVDYPATVTGSSWSVVIPSTGIQGGEYDLDVQISATDALGNSTSLTRTVEVDTVTGVTMATGAIGGDGTVNAVEHAEGITVTGTAEAGASVVVTFGTVVQTVTAGADGTWSVDYTSLQIPEGTYEAAITAVSTDAAGNTATATGSFMVDTDMVLSVDTASVEGGVVNAAEAADGITITGMAEPNATVVVEMNGFTHTVTSSATGEWSVDFAASEVPSGTLGAAVTVTATDPSGNVENVTGTVQIDTEAAIAFSPVPVEIDGVINAAEAANGVVINGTSEPGASVMVTFGTTTLPATVDSAGVWSVNFPASAIDPGEYAATVTAQATDAHGNSASTSMTVDVDTVANVSVQTATVETDGVINLAEREDGVDLIGTAEPGASVQVTFAGITKTVTADASGTWTAGYTKTDIPRGEDTHSVNVTATDAAGNSASTSGTVQVDTLVNELEMTGTPGGDGIINADEASQPITLTGTVEAGSTVEVRLGDVKLPASVAADGSWSVTFPGGSLPSGEYTANLFISATDAAGNTSVISDTVEVDTLVGDVALSAAPIEIDDVVNAMEASDGVIITGTATPGLTVTVTLGAASHQVVAAGDGSWTTTFLPGEVAAGTYEADITASITDGAGNSKTVADTVQIDTEVDLDWSAAPVAGDDIISAEEAEAGVIVSGTVEAGSSVVVTLGTASAVATVSGTSWSASFGPGEIPPGETLANMSAVATDPAGNTTQIGGSVEIDRVVNTLTTDGPVEGDDYVNADEASDGITLTGTVEQGSTVMVTLEGTTHAATVDAAGNWSVTFAEGDIPEGSYETTVQIVATDAVGNTRTVTDTFTVDTEVPDAPLIESFTKGGSGVREIGTSITEDEITIQELTDGGALADVTYDTDVNAQWGEMNFEFESPIPDGSHLVVTAEDDTGNNNSTLFVLEESGTNTVDLSGAGLAEVNLGAIDLQFAENSELTITPEVLAGLSENSNELIVHGGADDTVFMDGATAAGSTVIGGSTYNIYTLGTDGGTVIIDSDIEIQPTSVI